MILSHYTTRAGLEGMLRSRAFWATNFLDLDDPFEYFYAWTLINKEAMRLTMEKVPEDLRRKDFNLEHAANEASQQLRHFGKTADPYGQLYVFSFATGKDDDEDKRGILTLWKLKIDGYCLQYRDEDVRRVLQAETMWWNYEAVNFVPVRYGLNTEDATFKELTRQISCQYLRQIYEATRDHRLELEVGREMGRGVAFRRLLEFCASHKDPMYKDEREYRIFAYPSSRAEVRPFIGLARVKRIETSPSGKRYIALGGEIKPGFAPFRIMGANKADAQFGDLFNGYELQPDYEHVDLPIAA